jgi:predicted ATPase/DNA-binding CsgD family transcriptional regulator
VQFCVDAIGDMLVVEQLWKMPAIFTSLIGREREIAQCCALLTSAEVRWVTLLGAGGIGKTRLSIALAGELRQAFGDGICFVSLASLRDPEQVLPTVASELGLQDKNAPSLKQVQQFLGDKRLLLILDNAEQVAQVGPLLQEVLESCPDIKIVVTSRVALRVPAERQFWVSPLAVPDPKHLPESKALTQYSAIALFVQRACMLVSTFQVTEANAPALAEICLHLDGMPLAIELAAARIKLLPPQALLLRLDKSLQILTKGMSMQPVRQQTLRDTIKWSYDLLDLWEQQLFRLCAVFMNGFTLEAIEAVYAAGYEQDQGQRESVLDGVDSLIDKSLLQPPGQANEEEEPRLTLLETVREFGQECLLEQGEMETTRRVHAEYYLVLAEKAAPHLNTPQEVPWMRRLERDRANLRMAMDWSLEHDRQALKGELALRLGTALGQFWISCGSFQEGWDFLERALADCEGVTAKVLAEALSTASVLSVYLNEIDRSIRLSERSLALFKDLGEHARVAYQLRSLGWRAHLRYDFQRAHTLYEESFALYNALHDQEGSDKVLYNMAYLAQNERNYEQARTLYEEYLANQRSTGHRTAIAYALCQLAQLFYLTHAEPPLNEIQYMLDEGLVLAEEVGDKNIAAGLHEIMARVAFSRGDLVKAQSLIEGTIQFCRDSGRKSHLAGCLVLLARIMTRQGKYPPARSLFGESLALARQQGDIETLSDCLLSLVYLALAQKQYAWAARLCGSEEKLREETRIAIYPVERRLYEQAVATLRTFLGEKIFTLLWAEGRKLSPEAACSPHAALPAKQDAPPVMPVAREKVAAYPAGLSAREGEILRLVAQGLSDAEIAEQLVISPRTVNTHLTSIYHKLEVNSRAAATRFAFEHQIV